MVQLTEFSPPTDTRLLQDSTEALVGDKSLGVGALYISESHLSWLNRNGQGFSLDYPHISLHAISRDPNAHPKDNLYVMVDAEALGGIVEDEPMTNGSGEHESDEESDDSIKEIRFIPEDKGALEQMYKAMCECQELHPDEDDSFSGDEFEGGGGGEAGDFFTGEEAVTCLDAEGQATLAHLDTILQTPSAPLTGSGDGPSAPPQTAQNGAGAGGVEAMETEGQFDDAVDH